MTTKATAHDDSTEASPLLRSSGAETADTSYGSSTVSSSSATAVVENDDGDSSSSSNSGRTSPIREGLPEMAKRMHILLPAIGIGVYLSALDQTLIVATYARMSSDLQALNRTSWISTAYFLTLTCCQPLYGKLSDIFGRKGCLLFAYTIFGLGSLGCGLAQDIWQLIIARAVAGIGGGGMNAVTSILLSDIVPLRDRGMWQGYLNVIFGAGMATGAPLGGLMADSIGWRWSFIAQVPIVAAAFIACSLVLHLPSQDASNWREKMGKIDFLGAFCLVSAVLCLLIGLDNGSNAGWNKLETIVPLAISPALFVAFLLVEIKVASHPFAPGHIIFERSLFAGFMCNFFGVWGHMSVMFFLPLLYQAVDGRSTVQAGLLLLPGSFFATLSSLGGGIIIRRTGRFYWVTVAGWGILLVGIVPMVLFAGAWVNSELGTSVALSLTAIGGGSAITTSLVALLSNADKEDTAVVVACSYLFRSLGSAIGVSVASAILQAVLRTQLAARLGDGDAAWQIEERVRASLEYIKQLDPATAALVRRCYQIATIHVFGFQAVPMALAFLSAFFIKERKLGK